MSIFDAVQSAGAQALVGQPRSSSTPNDGPTVGVTPQTAPVPFWDVYPPTLGDSKDGDGSTSNSSFVPWDVCALGGWALPGIARVQVKSRKRFDVKKSKGVGGATLTFTGYDPSDVTIELRVWTPAHLNTLNSLIPQIVKQKLGGIGGAAAIASRLAVDINHPATTLVGIHSVVVEGLSSLEPSEQRGVMKMQIHCLEYIPPSKADVTGTAKGSQNLTGATAINPGQSQNVPMPSANASYTGPNGALASFPP